MDVSKTPGKIQIKFKMPNLSQEPPASSKALGIAPAQHRKLNSYSTEDSIQLGVQGFESSQE